MIIESSLGQQAATFTDSLNVKDAPSVEKTAGEESQETKIPEQSQGDTVSISIEARALSAAENSGGTDSESAAEQHIRILEEQIEKLKEEIKEIQEDETLSDKEKLQQVQSKQAQMMDLEKQLTEAKLGNAKSEGQSSGGGTRANGAGNSVSTF